MRTPDRRDQVRPVPLFLVIKGGVDPTAAGCHGPCAAIGGDPGLFAAPGGGQRLEDTAVAVLTAGAADEARAGSVAGKLQRCHGFTLGDRWELTGDLQQR